MTDGQFIFSVSFIYLSIGFLLWFFIVRKTIGRGLEAPFLFLTMITWIIVPDIIYDEYKMLKYLNKLNDTNAEFDKLIEELENANKNR